MTVSPQASEVEHDLRMIVGGNFSLDALGPEYEHILQRVRAAPIAYLDAFERLFTAPRIDPRVQSRLFLPSFLQLVADVAPDRVRAIASRLIGEYNAALGSADHAVGRAQNIEEARPEDTRRFAGNSISGSANFGRCWRSRSHNPAQRLLPRRGARIRDLRTNGLMGRP
jgi:hypothetical protein